MISMLIVEDNHFERESLRQCINWELVGVGEIYTAADGLEGLEVIKENKPEIVLTDIKMPRMSGLEMLDKATALDLHPKFVFCSAFEDFSYVQQAMRKGASNYLLKPVNQKELIQTIRDIIGAIVDEKLFEDERKRYYDEQEAYIGKIRTNFIKDLVLKKQHKRAGGIYSSMNDVYLKMHAGYSVASIEIFYESDDIENKHSVNELVLSRLSESLLHDTAEFFYNDIGILIVLLHSVKNHKDLHTAVSAVQAVFNAIKGQNQFQYFIGVSSISMDITDANQLYSQSCAALDKRVLMGYGKAEFYTDSTQSEPFSRPDQYNIKNTIQNIITKTVSGQELDPSFATLEKILASHYTNNIQGIQGVLIKLISDLLTHSYSQNTVKGDRPDYEIYQNVIDARSMPAAVAYAKQFCEDIRDRMATNSSNKTDRLVEQIMAILHSEYHENITLNYLSKKVYLSANYIRLIFKEKMNISILECLINIRMTKAKELLTATDLTIGDISGMVGYANSSYFCTAFKSETGLSPSEFRRAVKSKGE